MLSKLSQRQTARFIVSRVENTTRSQSASFLDPSLPGPSTRRAYASSSSPAYSPVAAARRTKRSSPSQDINSQSVSQGVFSRSTPMVVLPTPLPSDESSAKDGYYFPRSSYVETLNIIEACMFRGHDMPRARILFDGLRQAAAADADGVAKVDISLYNQFIVTYFDLATSRDEAERRRELVTSAWLVWDNLAEDGVQPDYMTYASMLMLSARFAPTAPRGVTLDTHKHTITDLLNSIHSKSLSVPATMERLLAYFDVAPTERAFLVSSVQQWAVTEGHTDVLVELGNVVTTTEGENPMVAEGEDPTADIPQVNPVTKKKVGLLPWQKEKKDQGIEDQTPFNLDALRSSMSEIIAARRHLSADPLSRQKLAEEAAIEDARERIQHEFQRLEAQGKASVVPMSKKSMQRWMWDWYEKLTPRLEEEVRAIVASEEKSRNRLVNGDRKISSNEKLHIGPFLSLLKPNQLALITIMEVLRLHGSGGISEGMKTARALIAVGMAVEQEYTAAVRKREMSKRNHLEKFYRHEQPQDLTSSSSTNSSSATGSSSQPLETAGGLSHVVARREAAKRDAEVESAATTEWTRAIQARVGSVLVDALMDTATVVRTIDHPVTGEPYSETQPAFNHEYEYLRGKKLGVIKLNPEVAREFAAGDGGVNTSMLHPRHLPMFVPPRPWVSHTSGAYFYNRSTAMRIKDSQEQQQYLREASQQGNLELIFSGLDVLGSTPWVINKDIFRVVLDIWNSGESLAEIPPAELDVPDPVKPDDYDTNDLAKKEYIQVLKETINKRRNNHSERCSVNYKLEIARAYLPDKFYFPHNLDFRGRAYPIPPNLNHIGDDLSRGLLKFADKRPLGVSGLRWLKIHLANVCGYDKASFDEREVWTMNHLEQIRDSATKPMEGERWWMKSDDPWQTLATCMELTNALAIEDPTTFESNLPVHQDGTCNGLQHYAALGGDSDGAKQVNLDVTEKPSDVYTYVAKMVDEVIAADVEKGNKIAKLLVGRVARKTVKQTVMTTVYGVTFIGARAQIEKQLRTSGDLSRDELWDASTYLARATLTCIADLFSGAKSIQNWLSSVARLIAKSIPPQRIARSQEPGVKAAGNKTTPATRVGSEQMTSVIWTTPMGLPIVQPYRKIKKRQLMTPVQSVFISDPNLQTQVNPSKQSSAFPPNFIHSLDATHMMLTALECRREELSFASVHDSYWTHACTVTRMSEIIRDTFVYLHSSDILGKLLSEFKERYEGYEVPVISLNAKEIDLINATTSVKIVVKAKGRPRSRATKQKAVQVENGENDEAEDTTTLAAQLEQNPELDISITSGDETPKSIPISKQYVKLNDILPPLPAKGDFSVETIKKSLYFFS